MDRECAHHGKIEVYTSRKEVTDPQPLKEIVTIDKITPDYVEKIAREVCRGSFS